MVGWRGSRPMAGKRRGTLKHKQRKTKKHIVVVSPGFFGLPFRSQFRSRLFSRSRAGARQRARKKIRQVQIGRSHMTATQIKYWKDYPEVRTQVHLLLWFVFLLLYFACFLFYFIFWGEGVIGDFLKQFYVCGRPVFCFVFFE